MHIGTYSQACGSPEATPIGGSERSPRKFTLRTYRGAGFSTDSKVLPIYPVTSSVHDELNRASAYEVHMVWQALPT